MSKQVIRELFKRPAQPQEPKRTPIGMLTHGPGSVQQSDILFTTSDKQGRKTYKYALVLVDLVTRTADAEPLTSKDSGEVLEGLQAMWKRNNAKGGLYAKALGQPPKLRLEVDSGSEYRGAVADYFKDIKVLIRYGRPGRHQQQAMAEGLNKVIGAAIGERQAAQELLTDETSREWVQDLPGIIAKWNNDNQRKDLPNDIKQSMASLPTCSGDECKLLTRGTRVRLLNEKDRPTDVRGVKQTGTRRAGDPYFNAKVYRVLSPFFIGGAAPRYILEDLDGNTVKGVTFRRNELRLVDPNETFPLGKDVIRGKPSKYIPKTLHGVRTQKRVKQYHVEWRGYPDKKDWTWEPKSALEESTEGKRLVAEFE